MHKKTYRWGRKKTEQLLRIDFIRFGIVGTVGFTVTAVFLKLFHVSFGIDVIPATFLSSELGMLSNFIFHEKWTYKYNDHKGKSVWKKLVHFHMSSWSGVVLITLIESVGVKVFNLDYLVALVIAAVITMFWNFFWTKYFIFTHRTPSVLMDPEDVVPIKKPKQDK